MKRYLILILILSICSIAVAASRGNMYSTRAGQCYAQMVDQYGNCDLTGLTGALPAWIVIDETDNTSCWYNGIFKQFCIDADTGRCTWYTAGGLANGSIYVDPIGGDITYDGEPAVVLKFKKPLTISPDEGNGGNNFIWHTFPDYVYRAGYLWEFQAIQGTLSGIETSDWFYIHNDTEPDHGGGAVNVFKIRGAKNAAHSLDSVFDVDDYWDYFYNQTHGYIAGDGTFGMTEAKQHTSGQAFKIRRYGAGPNLFELLGTTGTIPLAYIDSTTLYSGTTAGANMTYLSTTGTASSMYIPFAGTTGGYDDLHTNASLYYVPIVNTVYANTNGSHTGSNTGAQYGYVGSDLCSALSANNPFVIRRNGTADHILDFQNTNSGIVSYVGSLGGYWAYGITSQAPIVADRTNYIMSEITAPTAPTVALGAAGVLTGAYYYRITFGSPNGETESGAVSTVINPAAQKVELSNIPVSIDSTVTYRKIYRCSAGSGNLALKFLDTLPGNLTTTYSDDIADGSLGVAAPTINTTGSQIYKGTVRVGFAGLNSTAWGSNALRINTGYYNTAVGTSALNSSTGNYNTALGASALNSNSTGGSNTALGNQAGYNAGVVLNTNSNSVFIGRDANTSVNALTNVIVIGYQAQATVSNQVVLGNTSITSFLTTGAFSNPAAVTPVTITDADGARVGGATTPIGGTAFLIDQIMAVMDGSDTEYGQRIYLTNNAHSGASNNLIAQWIGVNSNSANANQVGTYYDMTGLDFGIQYSGIAAVGYACFDASGNLYWKNSACI